MACFKFEEIQIIRLPICILQITKNLIGGNQTARAVGRCHDMIFYVRLQSISLSVVYRVCLGLSGAHPPLPIRSRPPSLGPLLRWTGLVVNLTLALRPR